MKPNLDSKIAEDVNKTLDYIPLTWIEEVTRYIDVNSTLIVELSVLVVMGIVVWIVKTFTKLSAVDLFLLIFSVLAVTLNPLFALYNNNSVIEAFLYAVGVVIVVGALRFALKRDSDGRN